MENEYGAKLDRNGYAPSILSTTDECFLCGRTSVKLDRHEVYGAALRTKSKNLGCWCLLCHEPCHLTTIHQNAEKRRKLKALCQGIAMIRYDWSTEEFIKRFGRNYLDADRENQATP